MTKQRLSKILAAAGVASRRACEELIFQGQVKVNGETVKTPQTMVDVAIDKIQVANEIINQIQSKVYYILNKPSGYICSAVRGAHSKIVLDLFADEPTRLFTVGRLDKETQGLILLTNDGHFANRVIHPSSNIQKEYLVKTDQEITHEHLTALSEGALVEGTFVKPIRVTKVRRGTLKVVVMEGKKREVRVIVESVGLTVRELTRIRIGGLHLGLLPVGTWRPLTEKEKKIIFE